jgi:transcriptional regulator of acetoin/glycerol metabolism
MVMASPSQCEGKSKPSASLNWREKPANPRARVQYGVAYRDASTQNETRRVALMHVLVSSMAVFANRKWQHAPMLVLHEPSAGLRERYLSGLLDVPTVAPDPLVTCWERVRALGLPVDGSADPWAISSTELRSRRERLGGLLRAESALLGPIATDFASRSLVSILADADGVVLHRHGGGAFSEGAALVRLVEGACWSEDRRGTNAIGTALVEQRPVAVLGSAHFEQQNAGLFCYATPVRDAFGKVVCVLDVTGPMALHAEAVGFAVRAAGSALELVLRTQVFEGVVHGGLQALARLVESQKDAAFVMDVRGQLLLCNRAQEGLGAECVPSLHAVAGAGEKRGTAEAASGNAYDIEPLVAEGGRVVAYLAVRAAPARARPGQLAAESEDAAFAAIVGDDPVLCAEKARAKALAATALPVLLLAETGTGKELFARAIHAGSPRRAGPFVALNCGALSATLLESELFGHAPHAFTGASRSGADGKIAAAHAGTLFLDEVAEMPPALQAALLRFLDDGQFYRVGETKLRRADVRLVCATCRDLVGLVREGRFRQDLFYRIQGACVRPPPLRQRNDRLQLAERLLRADDKPHSLGKSAADYILGHDFPGNVRELKSALTYATSTAGSQILRREHFPEPLLLRDVPAPPASPRDEVQTRDGIVRQAVEAALRSTDGNLSQAARKLRMARSTLYRILQKGTEAEPAD